MYSVQETFRETKERHLHLGIFFSCSPKSRVKQFGQKIPLICSSLSVPLSVCLSFWFYFEVFFEVGHCLGIFILSVQNVGNKTNHLFPVNSVMLCHIWWDFRKLSADLMFGIQLEIAVCNWHLYVARYSPEIVWYFCSRTPKEQNNLQLAC